MREINRCDECSRLVAYDPEEVEVEEKIDEVRVMGGPDHYLYRRIVMRLCRTCLARVDATVGRRVYARGTKQEAPPCPEAAPPS